MNPPISHLLQSHNSPRPIRFIAHTLSLMVLSSLMLANGALAKSPLSPAALAAKPMAATERIYLHQAKKNDTFIKLANTYLTNRKDYSIFQKYNPGINPKAIPIGSKVRIPIAAMRADVAAPTVLAVSGDSKINGEALKIGQRVNERDKLATGESSFITIKLADGSTLTVQSKSAVEIERARLLANTTVTESVVKLQSGRVESAVAKQHAAARYEVRTPTANMGVRGTIFRAAAEANGKGISEVLEGNVAVSGATDQLSQGLPLNAGFGTFVLQDKPPAPPVKLLPQPLLADFVGTETRPEIVFSFAPVVGATGYRALVATDNQFLKPVSESVSQTPSIKLVDLPDGALFLQVRAIDKDGLEGMNSIKQLNVAARPFAPLAAMPLPLSRVSSGSVAFKWSPKVSQLKSSPTDSESEVTQYRLQVAKDAKFSQIVVDEKNIRELTYTPKQTLASGNYFWRVAALTMSGREGPMGEASTFMVQSSNAPTALRLDLDGQNALRWRTNEVGQHYQVQLSKDETFDTLVQNQVVTTNQMPIEKLPKNTYFVRVRSVDKNSTIANIVNAGEWSTTLAVEIFGGLF
jgi:hypothetical protein